MPFLLSFSPQAAAVAWIVHIIQAVAMMVRMAEAVNQGREMSPARLFGLLIGVSALSFCLSCGGLRGRFHLGTFGLCLLFLFMLLLFFTCIFCFLRARLPPMQAFSAAWWVSTVFSSGLSEARFFVPFGDSGGPGFWLGASCPSPAWGWVGVVLPLESCDLPPGDLRPYAPFDGDV